MEFIPFAVAGVQKAGEAINKRRHKKDHPDNQSQAPPPYDDDGRADEAPPEYLEAREQSPPDPRQNTQEDNHQQDRQDGKEG